MRKALLLLALAACASGGAVATRTTPAPPVKRKLLVAPNALGESVTIALSEEIDESNILAGAGSPMSAPAKVKAEVAIRVTTAKQPKTYWGGAKAPREKGRVGCTVDDVTSPGEAALEDAGATLAALLDSEQGRTACSFHRAPNGSISKVEVLTPDQLTGDADDEGDGLVGYPGHWSSALRLALRLASLPAPERELASGESWTVDEEVRVDHFAVRRHATFTIVAWTEHGARVKVDVLEEAPPQTYSRWEEARKEASAELAKYADAGIVITSNLVVPDGGMSPDLAAMFDDRVTLRVARLRAVGEIEVDGRRTLPRGELKITGSYEAVAERAKMTSRGSREGVLRYR